MGIFDKRVAFKPFEYPDVLKFKTAINHCFWLVTEFDFVGDVQDFHVHLDDVQRNAIKNTMLAISQIEVSVKRFWTKIGDRFPKAEIEQVGVTFGESEVRHSDSYSHLLEILGLNGEFDQLLENPVIQGRVDYLTKYLKGAADDSHQSYTLALTLFSIFIENVSLFTQFVVIRSFRQHLNMLKGIDNVVQATMQEECHVEGTEVLTPRGWVDFRDIQTGDDVVQYNHGKLEFVKILHKTERHYDGDVYRFHKAGVQCVVTPGHDMIYYNPAGELKKKSAEDFKPHSKTKVPHGGVLNNQGIDALTWDERLRIAIQADGTTLKWKDTGGQIHLRGECGGFTHAFNLTKQRKKDRLEWILVNGGYEYSTSPNGDETIYRVRFDQDHDYKEFEWVDSSDKSVSWCVDFVDECRRWDGYTTSHANTTGYSSTNKKAIDVVQAIAIFAGYRTSIGRRIDDRSDTYSDTYKLSFMKDGVLPASHGLKKDKLAYNGNVYCVTVPSGAIVTRYQDDVMFAGNCIHALFGVALIEIIKAENPEWFDEDFYAKLTRACKKAYEAESAIIDWILEAGDLPFLTKDSLKAFARRRFDDSLAMIGGDPVFGVEDAEVAEFEWFEVDLLSKNNPDFFHTRPVGYSKKTQACTAGDLF